MGLGDEMAMPPLQLRSGGRIANGGHPPVIRECSTSSGGAFSLMPHIPHEMCGYVLQCTDRLRACRLTSITRKKDTS